MSGRWVTGGGGGGGAGASSAALAALAAELGTDEATAAALAQVVNNHSTALAALPTTYVLAPSGGAKLVINPPVGYVPATNEIVLSSAADGVPAGGTAGQALVKTSGTDYAFGWGTAGLSQAAIQDLIGAILVDTSPPATPTGLSVTPGGGQLTLTWTANTEGDLFRYEITVGAGWVPVARTATAATVTGLTNGASYSCQVRAVDYSGNYSSPSTAVAGVPAVPALYSTDFTGSNGAAFPAAFTPYAYAGATFDIQNNRGRLLGPSSSYQDGGRIFLDKFAIGAPALGNGDWDFTVDAANSSGSVNDGNVMFVVRHGETNGAYYETPYSGYALIIKNSGYSLQKFVNNNVTSLSGNLGLVQAAAGVLNRYRLRIVGSTLQVKTWVPASAEPASWAWTGTDTSCTGGSVMYVGMGNGSSSSVEFTIDNLKIVAP